MYTFSSDLCHEHLLETRKKLLAYNDDAPFEPWKQAVKEKLTELLGDMPEPVPLDIQIEWEKDHDTYTEKRFSFDTEAFASVPCHLLVPKNAKKPCPVVICLQGHSTGMHVSMGEKRYLRDFDEGDEDEDYALQAVQEGYAALVMEQRGFGERTSHKSTIKHPLHQEWERYARTGCYHPSMVALLLGRTFIGERVWDVSRAIDVLGEFPEIDVDRVALLGNSGGGTATYYAACMDERIKIAVPSCSVCNFIESIGIMRHCSCNYVPGSAKWFDMGELAALIAPRKLLMVVGKKDHGFYIQGSYDAYEVVKKIYKKAGCPDNCRLVVGEEGHRFYADPSWKVFRELTGWE